ncbi:PAX3- and PAX7-binding protein 1 [Bicyclus anynana]|uniref:PAX3- and PAX7-binding protein 1 n=1 Tax=Bicyclus anynana TaxID=110368 RepID=A0ABM3M7R7_BICAN|nr:PAX3- and PAX7-binding protein 1 [Bicyclus anynana]
MSLFRKPKKFQRRMFCGDDDDDGDPEPPPPPIISHNRKENKPVKTTTLLSFADEEEETEVFKVKKSSQSKKLSKRRDKEKRRAPDGDSNKYDNHNDDITFEQPAEDENKEKEKQPKQKKRVNLEGLILSGREALAAGAGDLSDSGGEGEGRDTEEDSRGFHRYRPETVRAALAVAHSGHIPDAALIHAARKTRQQARELGDFVPIHSESGPGSRLIRDDGDDDDDDEDGRIQVRGLELPSDKPIRGTAAAALSDEENNSETEEWEEQQMQKAMSAMGDITGNGIELNPFAVAPPPPQLGETPAHLRPLRAPGDPPPANMDELADALQQRLMELEMSRQETMNKREAVRERLLAAARTRESCHARCAELEAAYRRAQAARGYITDLVECLDEKVRVARCTLSTASRRSDDEQARGGARAAAGGGAHARVAPRALRRAGGRVPARAGRPRVHHRPGRVLGREGACRSLHIVYRQQTMNKREAVRERLLAAARTRELRHARCAELEAAYRRAQAARGYITDLVECLDEKMPQLEALEARALALHRRRCEFLVERRRADVRDQAQDVLALAARAGAAKPVDSEEKRQRAAEREGRRRARRLKREAAGTASAHRDGDSSDDELPPAQLHHAQQETEAIRALSGRLFSDALSAWRDVRGVCARLSRLRRRHPVLYNDAYVADCLPKLLAPYVRHQLILWNPLADEDNEDYEKMDWYKCLMMYGVRSEKVASDSDESSESDSEAREPPRVTEDSVREDPDLMLVPTIIDKVVLPKVTELVEAAWDPVSVRACVRLRRLLERACELPASAALPRLAAAARARLAHALNADVFLPALPPQLLEGPGGAFWRRCLGSGVRLLRAALALSAPPPALNANSLVLALVETLCCAAGAAPGVQVAGAASALADTLPRAGELRARALRRLAALAQLALSRLHSDNPLHLKALEQARNSLFKVLLGTCTLIVLLTNSMVKCKMTHLLLSKLYTNLGVPV